MKTNVASLLLSCIIASAVALAAQTQPQDTDPPDEFEIPEVNIVGRIEGSELAVNLGFEAETKTRNRRILLLSGQAVLQNPGTAKTDYRLDYDSSAGAYYLVWPGTGRHKVDVEFVAKPIADANKPWHEVSLQVPGARLRRIRLLSDKADLEVELPEAMRVQRKTEGSRLVITAVLGPAQPLVVRWKPQVKLPDAKLVLASRGNTIVDVRPGLLHIDSLFDFQIAQGKIETLTFDLPSILSITALDGPNIRNWKLTEADGDLRSLVVELSRPQERDYRLRIRAEAALDKLPAEVDVPAIVPTGGIRASGHLAIGTDSALQLVILESTGLTQIDAAVFPRAQAGTAQERPIPTSKAFFYTYAGSRYRLRLSVDDIVPSYDVAGRFTVTVKQDDLVFDGELELDVRDAPIRELEVLVPAGMVVAAVDGNQVDDYHVSPAPDQNHPTTVRVVFAKPVTGRTLVHLRAELGHGPLGRPQAISALQVTGAKTHRGYIVIAAEPGIEIDEPQTENLRAVHTASVPLRVALAQFAYRFRQSDWRLQLNARSKAAGIRAEVFHLQSVGEALVYGSAVVNYIITGSPVDELRFSLPASVENVEFIGSDVRRWVRENDLWLVKLTRKVIGDYNLAVTFTQRYGPAQPIYLGALQCRDVQTQTGYVVVTSHLDLKLQLQAQGNIDPNSLLPIAIDELPPDYRLLTSSPILAAYKYVTEPHTALLSIDPYRRTMLLPVLVDMGVHRTTLAVHPDRRIESVTTVRYKVKNTTGQFLSLAVPEGADIWSVSLIETDEGREQRVRLAASRDTETGRLLVPLTRKANPNDPATIEIEYGKVHQAAGRWRWRFELTAPRCDVPVNYAEWLITTPAEWAITGGQANMVLQQPRIARIGLAPVLEQVHRFWLRSLEKWAEQPVIWIVAAAAFVVAVLLAIFGRRWVPGFVLGAFLAALVWAGIGAAMAGHVRQPAPANSLNYAQPVNADPNQALRVTVELVPAWRQNVTLPRLLAVGAIVLAALVIAAIKKRLRWPVLAAALAAGLYLAAEIPATWPALEAVLTWGAPVALAAWYCWRALAARRSRVNLSAPAVTATLGLLALAVCGGCANAAFGPKPITERSMIERLECKLLAGHDNVELAYKLRISAHEPCSFPLLDQSAVLVSDPEPARHLTIRAEDGRHTIVVDKGGLYELEAKFLVPLAPPGKDHQRRFDLPLPVALTNSVTMVIPDANVIVEAPNAIHLAHTVGQNQTTVETMFPPGESAGFTWRPKERQAAQEKVRFYAQDVALAHVSSGLLQVFHAVRFQIAQGQLDTLKLLIAPGQTVTSVAAPDIGSWRFDPATRELEIRLVRPVTGQYEVMLVAQSAGTSLPYNIRLEPLVVAEALNQHSIMGLAADSAVYLRLDRHPPSMNARDYLRDADQLIKKLPGLALEQITHAFRFDSPESVVAAEVLAVKSELRSQETARFNAEDDRLIYNSLWTIEIAKAGRFDIVLQIPPGYDIDTLTAQEVSHWDETADSPMRNVRVHFKRKLTGSVRLKLALSQPISQMPERLTVPRVMLEGVLKHTGQLVVGSEQGVRLSVASRQGLSEVNPAELGEPGQGLLAFRLLRPDWQLDLQTELIQPRITVQSLHVAKVTDGLVRHDHYLRYRLFHAGTKTFDLVLPAEATGVTITGPRIARREQLDLGQWRVELDDKIYDRPYLLRVTYETRYDQDTGQVPLAPVRCRNVDLQQGHTAVLVTDRVELAADSIDAALRPAEARSIPKYFGAPDLSDAVLCYRSTSPEYVLTVKARRHGAAEQIGADVRRTDIATVVTPAGQAIHRVSLVLRVGTRRHLQTTLPETGTIWSLSVDGQAVQPSIRADAQGREVLLVPLPQQTPNDVLVEIVYVASLPLAKTTSALAGWAGTHRIVGPRFDLPLKRITWYLYVPEDFSYEQFGGTLTVDKKTLSDQQVRRYNLQSYEQQIAEVTKANDEFAQYQQKLARELAQQGRQEYARRALSIGYNFSRGNTALNEDIRVDLDNLLKQQAKVGLVNARQRLRRQTSGADQPEEVIAVDAQGITFSQHQAERIESSLAEADNKNLDMITQRIIQTQEAAEASVAQLQIAMPFTGKLLRFTSPLQVQPQAPMEVTFRAVRRRITRIEPDLWYGLAFFVCLLILGAMVTFIRRRWDRLCTALTPRPRPAQPSPPTEPDGAEKPAEANDHDEPDGRVSADELT